MKQQTTKKQQLKFTVGISSFCLVLIIVTLSFAIAQNKGWEKPPNDPNQIISIPPSAFYTQGGNEFIVSTENEDFGLPKSDDRAGVDLTKYDLEFTFRNANGKKVQLWYKDSEFRNVYSWLRTIERNKPIRFNPSAKGSRNVDQFNDFTHIYAIGAKVVGGLNDIQITSVKLIRRD
jgi:hypothetical protein